MASSLLADLDHYYSIAGARHSGVFRKLCVVADSPALQGIAVYRFGRFASRRLRWPVLRQALSLTYYVLDKLTQLMWGIHIDTRADIAGGLYIGHSGGVFIGPVRMGAMCCVGHNVTIGVRVDTAADGVPTIGDHVWIGTGSVIYGPVVIGDGATIAPLTPVGRNVGPRTLVAGNPVRVIRADYDNSVQLLGPSAQDR